MKWSCSHLDAQSVMLEALAISKPTNHPEFLLMKEDGFTTISIKIFLTLSYQVLTHQLKMEWVKWPERKNFKFLNPETWEFSKIRVGIENFGFVKPTCSLKSNFQHRSSCFNVWDKSSLSHCFNKKHFLFNCFLSDMSAFEDFIC